MAERRMFAKAIINSGRFLKMPATSRLLYYDLGMAADDDGVVEAVAVMNATKATEDDLRVLVSKGYVKILNEDLVTYITDWGKNNQIRKDRYHEGIYKELLIAFENDNQMTTIRQPSDNQMTPESSLGQSRPGKVNSSSAPTLEQVEEYCRKKNYKTSAKAFFEYYSEREWEINGDPIRDWKALLGTWEKREQEKGKPNPRNSFNNFNQRTYNEAELERMLQESNPF